MKLFGQMQLMKIVYFSVFQFTWKCKIEFFPQLLHLMGDLRLAPPVDDKVRKVCSTHTFTLTQHSHKAHAHTTLTQHSHSHSHNTHTTLTRHSHNTHTTLTRHSYNTHTTHTRHGCSTKKNSDYQIPTIIPTKDVI